MQFIQSVLLTYLYIIMYMGLPEVSSFTDVSTCTVS